MPNFLKTALRTASRNLLVLVALGGVATVAFAFTEPSAGPTGGTVSAPVNTSGTAQRKTGSLSVGAGGVGTDDVTINTAGGVTAEGTVTGNILNAITQVSSPQYCIGVSCITAWPSSSSLSGSGTLNKVPKFTPNGTTLGDSQIFDNGTSVGIGTVSTSEKLHIAGNIYVANNWYKAGDSTAVSNAISAWSASGGVISGFSGGMAIGMGQDSSGCQGVGISSGSTPHAHFSRCSGEVSVGLYTSGPSQLRLYAEQPAGTAASDIILYKTGSMVMRSQQTTRLTVDSSGVMVDGDIRMNRSSRATVYPSGSNVPANMDFQIRSAGTGVLQLNGDNGGPVTIGNGGGSVGIGVFPSWRLQLGVDSAGKPNGGSWGNSSDERLKTTIVPLNGALKKLTALRGVQFEWKNPGEHASYLGEVRAGFIAQEVEEIFPQFVSEIDASGKDRELTVDGRIKTLTLPFDFDAYLVEAIKELQAEIDVLKAENQMLKERVESLEGR